MPHGFFRRCYSAALISSAFAIGCTSTSNVSSVGIPVTNSSSAQALQSGPPTVSGGSVSASLLEQLSLERINRARLRPGAEATANGIAVDEGVPGQIDTTPKQALALNATLNGTANAHSVDMLNQDYFAHNTPAGQTPFQRMTAAGYDFITAGENLVWRGTTGALDELAVVESEHTDLFVDTGVPSRGHRLSMLNPDFREVGIGIVRGLFNDGGVNYAAMMQTQDFGTQPVAETFVLGVVYNDNNGNGQYDYGEGVANSIVSLDGVTKTTNAGGGYSFAITQSGSFTLNFVSSNNSLPIEIQPGDRNLKVDLIGNRRIVVNLGLGPL
ncbi:MAG TPA: CAP domain-containing protein [Phycisphaerae bacterium]|nr:CAP domain-containing protein [Phycisphaerae bacterium]